MQKNRKRIIIVTIILITILLFTLYYTNIVLPLVNSLAGEEIRAEVSNIINYSNTYIQTLSLFYNDYFTIYYDNDKKVSAIIANAGLINQISMIIQKKVQNQLNELRTKKITLPAGAFTGSSLLASFGIAIPINVKTVCNCYTKLENSYVTMGMNQVKHTLKINLYVDMEILIPMKSEKTVINSCILMAENIIVGEVPDTLLIGNDVSNYLDLVP